MSKTIKIDLNDLSSIDDAIKQVQEYQQKFSEKLRILEAKLANYGLRIASQSFDNAKYAGLNDVNCYVVPLDTGNGFKVVAEGSSVLFIEFGTGILNPEHPQSAEFGFKHGTYGKRRGANPKGWVYDGDPGNAGFVMKNGKVWTSGNPPSKSMYQASKGMAKELEHMIKEVFND